METKKNFVLRKSLFLVSILFLFLFLFSFASALSIGDEACMDETNWCSSIFVIGDYYYCDIDDVIVCEYGCDNHACQDVSTPECSLNYDKCEEQSRYECVNNSWEFQEVCDGSCVNPTVTYSYCDSPVVNDTIPVSLPVSSLISTDIENGDAGASYNIWVDARPSHFVNYIGNVTGYSVYLFDKTSSFGYNSCTDIDLLIFDNTSTMIYNISSDSFSYSVPGLYFLLNFSFDSLYLDGSSYFVFDGSNPLGDCFVPIAFDSNGTVYDMFFKYNITTSSFSAEVDTSFPSFFLHSGNATIPSFSDVEISVSSSVDLNLSSGSSDWDYISVYALDPINNFTSIISTNGYAGTLYADYYDVEISSDGILSISSYARPYNVTLYIEYCFDSAGSNCETVSLDIYISGSLSDVIQLKPFFTYYNLGFYDSQSFSGNYYFQYYDEIIFSIPDSNYTGLLNSTFPFSYRNNTNATSNFSYIIDYNCSIDSDEISYNFLGDINVTLECGSLQSYFILSAYNNYNQFVVVNASNSENTVSDYFILLSGNPNLLVGELPDRSYLDSSDLSFNATNFNDVSDSFSGVFMDSSGSVPSSFVVGKIILTFVVLLIFFFIFIMKKFNSFPLAIGVCWSLFLVLLFFFARINYLNSYSLPVFLSSLSLLFLIFKFKGGSA